MKYVKKDTSNADAKAIISKMIRGQHALTKASVESVDNMSSEELVFAAMKVDRNSRGWIQNVNPSEGANLNPGKDVVEADIKPNVNFLQNPVGFFKN